MNPTSGLAAACCRQMLAAAEADLEPNFAYLGLEQRGWIEAVGRGRQGEPAREEVFLQHQLREGPQLRPPMPTPHLPVRSLVNRSGLGRVTTFVARLQGASAQLKARVNSSTKSRRSQAKPPSVSGTRPKWP